MQWFYTPEMRGGRFTLPEEESSHCVRVMRLGEGDEVSLTDGVGNLYLCRIVRANPKACEVEAVSVTHACGERPYRVHIAVAPTKNIERIEWLVEKCTEIGVDAITLLICDHSERRTVRIDRLERIAVAALKQSQKCRLPIISGPIPFQEFIRKTEADCKVICYCEGERILFSKICPREKSVVVLIGPEGDFSKEEVLSATGLGYQTASLGESRLRTETAALVACDTVSLLNQ